MSHANSIISAPVQMPSDLAGILGISGTSLADACRSSVINKWAKYKPVRYPNVDTLAGWDSNNNRWGSGAIWWKATDGLCGFSTDVASEFGDPTNSSSFAYKLIHGQLGCRFIPPSLSCTMYRRYGHQRKKHHLKSDIPHSAPIGQQYRLRRQYRPAFV